MSTINLKYKGGTKRDARDTHEAYLVLGSRGVDHEGDLLLTAGAMSATELKAQGEALKAEIDKAVKQGMRKLELRARAGSTPN
jgi:hypothetical protein